MCALSRAPPPSSALFHTRTATRAHTHTHTLPNSAHTAHQRLTSLVHPTSLSLCALRFAPRRSSAGAAPSSIAFTPPHLHLRTHPPVPRKLRDFDAPLAGELLQNPLSTIPAFNEALGEFIAAKPDFVSKTKELPTMQLGFEGNFGSQHVSPRQLLAFLLGRMVCVEGIVTKCSLVRPKVVKSTHFCPATKKFSQREYRDATSFEGAPTQSVYPTKDENNNPLETEFGLR